MALSGLDIFKLLPKTNCGDCNVPTCMAFAMKLAQKKADLSECPHASEEAKVTLGAASEPPIRLVKIGGTNALEVGNETVMFRHEKTFFHPTGVAIELRTSEGEEKLLSKIKEIEGYNVERVGEELSADLFFISHDSKNKEDFLKTVVLAKENSAKGIILDCSDEEILREGIELLKDTCPAVLLKNELSDKNIELTQNSDVSLILTAKSYDDLAKQTEKARNSGVNNLILNLENQNIGNQLQHNAILRRSALKKYFKPFGYPLFTYIHAESELDMLARASALLCKYDSIIVLPKYDKAMLYTLFTLRQNIYTDPQKPIQVDPKVYPIGEPTPESPVFVTTNFSLTYFIVSGEIENSGISAHLVVADAEGQSVLTAWAAGKFVGETIAKFIKDIKLEQQVKTRKIVIPGLVSQISGDLEDNLPGWEVIVGCQEASDIPSFVKSVKLT
ncbi:MAG: acetyl-CoA decarbonylase/synthase complex subunit gamma [Candidatus Aminicenantes bacterium]|nr:acetyl-CoA decarbonylase/synthase complex subunit gamma [Candidatus Aminicenantes bacterium]MBL7084231.1 acetyl-CoA decarbonylase/synthase complex subunit gamma [Candidatus Aminicenantes bacterium]